jgi:hypothetical protein
MPDDVPLVLSDKRNDRVSRCMEISHESRLGGLSKRRAHNGIDGIRVAVGLISYEHGA